MITPTDGDGNGRDVSGVMQSHGFYNRHSLPQHQAAAFAEPLLRQAARAIPPPAAGRPILIADYGAAQGGNSLAPIRLAISEIRTRIEDATAISVVHTDIPADDFSALFTLLETSPDSYLRDARNVFPFAAGRTFYKQIFPPEAVSLGWSAIAVHWLSSAPATIEGHIWSPRADRPTLAAFAGQSARDWQDFLSWRAIEMQPGAQLVIIGGASDENGDSAANGLMDMANSALQEMVAAGSLTREEYRRMVIPTYNRTADEFAAPFADAGGAGGLSLRHLQCDTLRDPIWTRYEQGGDGDAFAAAYLNFFDAAFAPSIFSSLAIGRQPEDRQAIKLEFDARLKGRIIADPASASCRWRVVTMLIARDR